MCSWRSAAVLLAALFALGSAQAQTKFPGIGRAATPAEVTAWDIDVRPDFQGLPPGSGSVAKGQEVWEAKCASCHGIFGESTEVFNPITGGTAAADMQTGRVASLQNNSHPGRTTLMKLAHLSTLWDYIHRAMPWAQPKSLTTEEVYATTAYILHLGGILPADFTLSDRNMAEIQQRLPNRNGMSTAHALWPGRELGGQARPDVRGTACMSNCDAQGQLASSIPDYARNAHGNLAEQTRMVGPQRGADTTRSAGAPALPAVAVPPTTVAAAAPSPAATAPPAAADTGKTLAAVLQKYACNACHAQATKVVGPAWNDIAKKHGGQAAYLAGKIKGGSTGVWGAVPMPPQALSDAESRRIAAWLAAGAAP